MFHYDAAKVCELLGFTNNCTTPMPEVELSQGEVLLWVPGIRLTQLRNSPLGKERLFIVPRSNKKNWKKQKLSISDEMALGQDIALRVLL